MSKIIKRMLEIPDLNRHSVFLWGPRQTGKSYWIKTHLANAIIIDLLKTDVLAEYASRPSLIRERFNTEGQASAAPIVIDEVQKLPVLLDEVHWLIENAGRHFLLTGSSARKLKRGHANLLAGRARRREMKPLCYPEVDEIDLKSIMISGLIPPHFLSEEPIEDIRAYVNDYLKEEILEKGLVNNFPPFSDFLRVAALSSGDLIN